MLVIARALGSLWKSPGSGVHRTEGEEEQWGTLGRQEDGVLGSQGL